MRWFKVLMLIGGFWIVVEAIQTINSVPYLRILFAWPEGITAWAIIATLFVIGWQSFETAKSAKAGLLNAQALVNSERPWLIAELVESSQIPNFYKIQITNYGRTPARFISGDAAHIFIERPDLLPTPPYYSSLFVFPKQHLIAPEKGFSIPPGYNLTSLLQRPEAANKTLVITGVRRKSSRPRVTL